MLNLIFFQIYSLSSMLKLLTHIMIIVRMSNYSLQIVLKSFEEWICSHIMMLKSDLQHWEYKFNQIKVWRVWQQKSDHMTLILNYLDDNLVDVCEVIIQYHNIRSYWLSAESWQKHWAQSIKKIRHFKIVFFDLSIEYSVSDCHCSTDTLYTVSLNISRIV